MTRPPSNQIAALSRAPNLPFLLYDGDAEVFSLFGFPGPVNANTKVSRQASSVLPLDLMLTENFDGLCEQAILAFDPGNLDDIFDDDPFTNDESDGTADFATNIPEADTFGIFRNDQRMSSLAAEIFSSPANIRKSEEERRSSLLTLQHLLSPAQAHRFVSRYFETWHPICSIIHRPSFAVESAPDSIILAILMLGAVYSPNDEDRRIALSVIDYVEDYIFSHDFSNSNGVARPGTSLDNDAELHFLQASFLLVVAQYWSGSESSRRRVSTSRFERVLEVSPQVLEQCSKACLS